MPDDLERKVANLEVVTTDLARLVSKSRLQLGVNEQGIANLSAKMDTNSTDILAALNKLQSAQDVHMARSDEKFNSTHISLDKVIDKLDQTAQRLSANESLSQQLRSQSATQFEQIGDLEAAVAGIPGGAPVGAPAAMMPSPSFIDSPNLKYIIAPVIIILLGLFGLAGYNMTGDAKDLLGVPEVEQ